MQNRVWLSLVLAASARVAALPGQGARLNAYSVHPQLGVDAAYAGELSQPAHLGNGGFGILLNYHQPLDRFGIFAMRIEAGLGSFGAAKTIVTEHPGTYSQSQTHVEISHELFLFDAGLQLQVPRGILRPYVAVNAGAARFASSVTVSQQFGYSADSSSLADNALMYSGAAGLLLMINGRQAPVFLDVGFEAFRARPFDALLIRDAGTDSQGALIIPSERLPVISRYLLYAGVTFTLH